VTRKPAAAGLFYEADPNSLRKRIDWCFTHSLGPGKTPSISSSRQKKSLGFQVPHAGYMYSGPIAAYTYAKIADEGKPDTFIIIGPNHTGFGSAVSVYPSGKWLTPFGEVEIDEELASEIISNSRFAEADTVAHAQEHSIEVQLPFIQYLFKTLRFVPIALLYQTPEVSKDIADAIVKAIEKLGRDVIILASSDMTHYEPHEVAVKKDNLAIDRIIDLDPDGLYKVVVSYEVSMCGVGPVMALLYFAKALGGTKGELLKYATSGDISGDKSAVVGYASVRVF
jgi:hypothetical protein